MSTLDLIALVAIFVLTWLVTFVITWLVTAWAFRWWPFKETPARLTGKNLDAMAWDRARIERKPWESDHRFRKRVIETIRGESRERVRPAGCDPRGEQ